MGEQWILSISQLCQLDPPGQIDLQVTMQSRIVYNIDIKTVGWTIMTGWAWTVLNFLLSSPEVEAIITGKHILISTFFKLCWIWTTEVWENQFSFHWREVGIDWWNFIFSCITWLWEVERIFHQFFSKDLRLFVTSTSMNFQAMLRFTWNIGHTETGQKKKGQL